MIESVHDEFYAASLQKPAQDLLAAQLRALIVLSIRLEQYSRIP